LLGQFSVSRNRTKGFPAAGPADGTIAGGGLAQFTELNAQTSTRWKRSDVASGQNKFVWYFTAGHQTQDWRYYLTRQGWHQGEPLSRSAFDAQPFCIANGGFRPSSGTRVTHTCDIPINRSGYHVILATWDIADTGNAFYQVIDVNIRSDAAVNSLKVQINPFSAVQPKQQRSSACHDSAAHGCALPPEMSRKNIKGRNEAWIFTTIANARSLAFVCDLT
jgi:chitin-binding protein